MDETARIRLQIRVVLVVLRGEISRMDRWGLSGEARAAFLDSLRLRSLEVLDATRARLNGRAAWHPQLIEEIEAARAEVAAVS